MTSGNHPLQEISAMPIYEYYSPDTNKVYQFLASTSADANRTPRCPDGEHFRMEKRISSFAITHAEGPGILHPEQEQDISGKEAILADLEKDFHKIDENNPDPRAVGALMERLGELSGEPLTPSMREMARQLKNGADMDALEHQFGEQIEQEMAEIADPATDGSSTDSASKARLLLKKLRKLPRQDPELYKLTDYL